jgi:hypothetical protein
MTKLGVLVITIVLLLFSSMEDAASIQTVLAWENKSDIAPSKFCDNTIMDRLVQEGFIDIYTNKGDPGCR